MPMTQIDERAALVVIDLQKGIAAIPAAHPMSEIVSRAAELARAFRAKGMPVVLVNVTGAAPGRTQTPRPAFSLPPDWAEIHPELEPQPSDKTVSKQRWGTFLGTDLDEFLRGQGVTQIVLTGVATSIGVESSARSAYDLGYNVVLVVDAMTDRSAEAHQWCVEKIFPRLGEIDSTANVLRLLNRQAACGRGHN